MSDNMVIPVRFVVVNFAGNKISFIRKATFATNNTHVKSVDVSANRLEFLENEGFANLPSLQKLDLSNNLIANLTALVIIIIQVFRRRTNNCRLKKLNVLLLCLFTYKNC